MTSFNVQYSQVDGLRTRLQVCLDMTAKQLDELICCWALEIGLDLSEDELNSLIDRLQKAMEDPPSH